jgi:mono/diheme cytochrome c family protein
MRRILMACGLVLLCGLTGAIVALNRLDEDTGSAMQAVPDAAQIARGEYLARIGNCMDCHTVRGAAEGAGGRGIETPFGTVYSANITPDDETGIGRWTAADFWRALHNGRSRDGHLLYPAFPYPNYTRITREDADALHAWLKSRTPAKAAVREHDLRFPYNTQAALAVWRALYFRPGVFQPDPARSAQLNRGAYLVQGPGHCSACHGARNGWGATREQLDLAGGLIAVQNWYAPSLASEHEAGVAGWEVANITALLRTGSAPGGWATGPMADVVSRSTQYLHDDDAVAMAVFLKNLPPQAATLDAPAGSPPDAQARRSDGRGARLYEDHCQSCHGDAGQGVPGAYPPLAGNRSVNLPSPANLVQNVLHGGFAPATRSDPRPYGMPPFVLSLTDRDIASVVTHVRRSWGNHAGEVSEIEVGSLRNSARE